MGRVGGRGFSCRGYRQCRLAVGWEICDWVEWFLTAYLASKMRRLELARTDFCILLTNFKSKSHNGFPFFIRVLICFFFWGFSDLFFTKPRFCHSASFCLFLPPRFCADVSLVWAAMAFATANAGDELSGSHVALRHSPREADPLSFQGIGESTRPSPECCRKQNRFSGLDFARDSDTHQWGYR